MAPVKLFNASLIKKHRFRFCSTPKKNYFLLSEVSHRLGDRLDDMLRSFEATLEIGNRVPVSSQEKYRSKLGKLTHLSSIEQLSDTQKSLIEGGVLPVAPQTQDLILSHSEFHWYNNLPEVFFQIYHALVPDGLFLTAFFGGETLTELQGALMQAEIELKGGVSPHVSPFMPLYDVASLVQRTGFSLPVVDREKITIEYQDLKSLLSDLRHEGEGLALYASFKGLSPKSLFKRAEEIYRKKDGLANGRLKATFEVFYVQAWKPSSKQPQPLKRGSGKSSFADALSGKPL